MAKSKNMTYNPADFAQQQENIRKAKEAGCDDFLAKPFKVENLIEIVKKYLGEEF